MIQLCATSLVGGTDQCGEERLPPPPNHGVTLPLHNLHLCGRKCQLLYQVLGHHGRHIRVLRPVPEHTTGRRKGRGRGRRESEGGLYLLKREVPLARLEYRVLRWALSAHMDKHAYIRRHTGTNE